MSHSTTTTTQRARRGYVCDVCGQTIASGVVYARWAGTGDGGWWSVRAHRCCARVVNDRARGARRRDSVFDVVDGGDGWAADEPLAELILRGSGAMIEAAIARLSGELRDEAEAVLRPLLDAYAAEQPQRDEAAALEGMEVGMEVGT